VRPIYRTGIPLPSRCCILYIFISTNISTGYFKHAAHSPFFSSKCRLFHNAAFFWFMYYSHFTYRVCYNLNVKLRCQKVKPLKPELNPICYLLALLDHHFLHVSRIWVKSLTNRLLMSYIYIWSTYS